jgi:hypothetical protein
MEKGNLIGGVEGYREHLPREVVVIATLSLRTCI